MSGSYSNNALFHKITQVNNVWKYAAAFISLRLYTVFHLLKCTQAY